MPAVFTGGTRMTTGHWFVKINVIGKNGTVFLTGTDVFGVS